MAVLVTGSRFDVEEEPDREAYVMDTLLRAIPAGEIVLVGDARGVDALTWSTLHGRNQVVIFAAKWKSHGSDCWCTDRSEGSTCKYAGKRRNRVMLDQRPERVISLWDGRSPGTKDTVTEAEKRGIPVERYRLP